MRGVGVLVIVLGLLLVACGSALPPPSPAPTATAAEKPTLTRFDSYWFSFEYPSTWKVLGHYVACGLPHGPTIVGAVGIGSIDLEAYPPAGPGDHPRPMAEVGPVPDTDTEYCPAAPNWTVPDSGVVVAIHSGPVCCVMPRRDPPLHQARGSCRSTASMRSSPIRSQGSCGISMQGGPHTSRRAGAGTPRLTQRRK